MKKAAKPARSRSKAVRPAVREELPVPEEEASAAACPFAVVGIGASAGGLEALELFLGNVPEGSGLAIVIVQHLDPTHKGMMVELLQRRTTMTVAQARDRLRVAPDCVYVIPPNRDMSILHGVLHLFRPAEPRGLRLPIDFFLRSLALDQRGRSIAVILSGMGSDGSLGLRAIKEHAGLVFVQDPTSAKFDSMPRSAIDGNLADVIAPPEDLPGKILACLRHLPLVTSPELAADEVTRSGIEKALILLRSQTGHDFSMYKKTTVNRRIERRMGIHQIDRITSYVRFLQQNPQEVELLFRELLIGVTRFFRDPAAWEQMGKEVLPALLTGRTPDQAPRAWVPGCASGEEAYSLAILRREAMEAHNPEMPGGGPLPQIFATDLDQDAIVRAREGVFPPNIAADVTPERLSRYFIQVERGYQVSMSVREMVVFAQQNLIMDPPFTRLDILSCRNLLIYLTQELQKKLLPLFHFSLNPGGYLFLGSAETIGGFGHMFTPLSGNGRIYRKRNSGQQVEPILLPVVAATARSGPSLPPPEPQVKIQALADQVLLKKYSPAAVLTTVQGDILYIHGRTGVYLEPAAGKANWNVSAMAREGLRAELGAAFRKALRQGEAVTVRQAAGPDGGSPAVEVTVEPLKEPEALRGMVLVVFRDVVVPPEACGPSKGRGKTAHSARVTRLEQENARARQELQNVREEMQMSQEELKSVNEEMQSTNEELQSSNEELTTSKEEMQSMNEEMQTVNQELQAKVDELSRINNDMKNLLDSTNIATLFLDNALCVRRFTHEAARITRLISGDVGRPITEIVSDPIYPELAEDVREVLRTLVGKEKQVSTLDGRWFSARILPYRTLENMIDGVVITFTDISAAKRLEAELRARETTLKGMLDAKE